MANNQPDNQLEKRPLSYGEKAVGLSFNPSTKPEVDNIKRLSADLIDELNDQKNSGTHDGEAMAQFTLAIRKIQEGQMWGVKAATWG